MLLLARRSFCSRPLLATWPSRGCVATRRASTSAEAQLEYASTCFFPTAWTPVPLLRVTQHNHDTSVFEFGLPEGRKLDLPVCACLLLRAGTIADGADVVRPYTPISTNATTGSFELMVKIYPDGIASQFLQNLAVGSAVDFKHIAFNIKAQHPFSKTHIAMICGGSGITPMYQALQTIFSDHVRPEHISRIVALLAAGQAHVRYLSVVIVVLPTAQADSTRVTLLFANKSMADILLKEELDAMSAAHPDRFEVSTTPRQSP